MRYHNLIVLAVYWHVSIKALAIPLTSVVLAEAGERCGGNMINARNCTDGLECVGEVMVPDVGGVCQLKQRSFSLAGERCGGNIDGAKPCASGLLCVSKSLLPAGDVGGICQTHDPKTETAFEAASTISGSATVTKSVPEPSATQYALEGEHCGGIIGAVGTRFCTAGLVCVSVPDSASGSGGICRTGADSPPALEGENCSDSQPCAAGLVCLIVQPGDTPLNTLQAGADIARNATSNTLTSKCQTDSAILSVAALGEYCGGKGHGSSKRCAAGLVCVPRSHLPISDVEGVCETDNS